MRTTDTPTGTLLGDRYLLTRPLGAGASAAVYLAEDQSLRRDVAVKVLRAGLAHDDAFLRRFRAEAVAVAGLNHPHVLRVFDWGEGGGDAWLVMEYLAGGSLRDLLDARGRLSVEQTASIGTQAADGLAYAHAQGFVHRDVKPANLLFDDTGHVRIADFGVARALAEASWTEPEGVIGTVRYTSPEQAQGHPLDGKADVYSLALVLYECLTGEVPFAADTQVATLHARIGATLPFHPALGELEGVLRDAAAPDPDARLDAAQLLARLSALSRELPGAEGAPGRTHSVIGFSPPSAAELSGQHRAVGRSSRPAAPAPGADATELGLADATVVGAAITVPRSPDKAPAKPTSRSNGTAAGPAATTVAPPAAADTVAAATVAVALPPAVPSDPPSQRRRWRSVLVGLVLVAALVVGLLYALNPFATATYRVPLLVNSTLAHATAALNADHDMTVKVDGYAPSLVVALNHIIKQEPSPNALVPGGTTVHVLLSGGPPPRPVPTVVGKTCSAATLALRKAGFTATCPPSLYTFSATIPQGMVVGVYAGNAANPTSAALGSALTIQLSKGPPPTPVPNVVGLPGLQALATLRQSGFVPVAVHVFDRAVHAGNVISVLPSVGTKLQPGREVRVTVSSGAPATVPSLGHSSLSAAEQIIVNAGLTVLAVHGATNAHTWTTQPPAGTEVAAGSGVVLYGH
jgi:eukaryotic-like serine/threonine-protein kinase